MLKLIAWTDRGAQNNKDAADLYRLLATYSEAGNFDRLYDQELELLEAVEFDLDLAGVHDDSGVSGCSLFVALLCPVEHDSRMVLTRTSETIPVAAGHMTLGTWQGIFLFEHRAAAHQREISVSVIGCG